MDNTIENQQLADRLVCWIRERVTSAGLKGVVFGMSGGVDSSVIATLSKQAFPESSLGLVMPCHSIGQDKQDAMLVAAQFAIKTQEIALDSVYDSLVQILSSSMSTPLSKLTQGNLKEAAAHDNPIPCQSAWLYRGRLWKPQRTGHRLFYEVRNSGVDILPLGNLVKAQVGHWPVIWESGRNHHQAALSRAMAGADR